MTSLPVPADQGLALLVWPGPDGSVGGGALRRPLVLTAAAGCFSLGVGAAAYAVTRTAWRRTLAAVLAVLALAASVALVVGAVGSVLVVRATAGSW
jgi:hypothetical protein